MSFPKFKCRCLFLIPVFFYITSPCINSFCSDVHFVRKNNNKITSKEIETCINGLKYLSADFIQKNSNGEIYTGHIYISKENKTQHVRVDYEDGIKQRIFIKNDIIKIIDLRTKKEIVNSISQTPIYSILNHGFDLSKEDYSIDLGDSKYAYCTIHQVTLYGKTHVKLIFSKYENGNIKNLEGWIIEEPNGNVVIFNLLSKNMFVNDKSKLPKGVFEGNF